MILADSPWPRFGGDQANRGHRNISGPIAGSTIRYINLLEDRESGATPSEYMAGVVVMADRSLRVTYAGMVYAYSPEHHLLWRRDLRPYYPPGDASLQWHSLPTALQTGQVLVGLSRALLLVAADGNIVNVHGSDDLLDDSRLSPNVSRSGSPLVSSPLGAMYLLLDGTWLQIGRRGFGYDLDPPAVYDDDSLAIAGYAGTGFCRVDLDGHMRWQTDFGSADMVPTINQHQVAAVGSVSMNITTFYSPEGKRIGTYPHAAVCAEHPAGGWIARTHDRLSLDAGIARLDPTGTELWTYGVKMAKGGRRVQPIVDTEGRIYVRHLGGILCLNQDGRLVFTIDLPSERPDPISLIAPGVLMCLSGNHLVCIR